ncbi:DUF6381 family protein [Streptomyces bambusae]|uniref:Uncharacterized protein n=1 Tax=Streptomyces bambusae TaxID=1550616 RepID=A0ABS6Z386_9ACTN|nr:DUF6381 family protein [Streptomyces bambusae]MBW5482220.1 hypothetical protein [Streptomyces bambusae]
MTRETRPAHGPAPGRDRRPAQGPDHEERDEQRRVREEDRAEHLLEQARRAEDPEAADRLRHRAAVLRDRAERLHPPGHRDIVADEEI